MKDKSIEDKAKEESVKLYPESNATLEEVGRRKHYLIQLANYDMKDLQKAYVNGYLEGAAGNGNRWVKASERLPELPNPLPPDTEDERGVLFVNRTHSCGTFWYPSYDQLPESIMNLQFEGWNVEQWEWLDESQSTNIEAESFRSANKIMSKSINESIKIITERNDRIKQLENALRKIEKCRNLFDILDITDKYLTSKVSDESSSPNQLEEFPQAELYLKALDELDKTRNRVKELEGLLDWIRDKYTLILNNETYMNMAIEKIHQSLNKQ